MTAQQPRLRTLAAVVVLSIAAACTPSPTATTPPPSPQPTYLCTPSTPGASPSPCDKATYEEQQKTRALEAEAKAVYERYWKEYTRLLQAGGATEATPELRAAVAEPALADLVALLRYQNEKGLTPQPLVTSLKLGVRSAPIQKDAEVSIIACEDTSGSIFLDAAGRKAANGLLNVQVSGLKRIDGSLKIYYNQEGSPPCPVT